MGFQVTTNILFLELGNAYMMLILLLFVKLNIRLMEEKNNDNNDSVC